MGVLGIDIGGSGLKGQLSISKLGSLCLSGIVFQLQKRRNRLM
jgi:hypothetical protein